MKIVGSSFLKFVVAAILVVVAISYVFSKRTSRLGKSSTVATREFNHPEDANESGIGPAIGERIDLVHLRDERGVSLSEKISDGLSMLVLVDPGCGAPKGASDQLGMVHDGLRQLGIQHYLISVTASGPPSEFFAYAHWLSSESPVFLWEKSAVPSEKLYTMVLPSHVLIDKNGVIARKCLAQVSPKRSANGWQRKSSQTRSLNWRQGKRKISLSCQTVESSAAR